MSRTDNAEAQIEARRGEDLGVSVNGFLEKNASLGGGAFEGADRASRELASWAPRITSADQAISKDKTLLDGRAIDLLRNNGPTIGASNTQKDSIVGAQYRLNASPAFKYLGLDEGWADEFQQEVEESFTLYAESDSKWVDVERRSTLTDLIRLNIGCVFSGGEAVATMNWMGGRRPFRSAMQVIDANRVCNPRDEVDSKYLRRGVKYNRDGSIEGLWVRRALANDSTRLTEGYEWDFWPIRKKWGRLQMLYIAETARPEQSRGVADIVAALKETRMGKRFHEVSLANAIVQASFAAAIESELPPEMAFEMIGGTGGDARTNASMSFLQAIAEYSRGGKNLDIDGAKIPYLFPGTKLKLTPAGTAPAGLGENLEESLNRYIAVTLGLSYEEYTHDYSKTNYSSLRAATNKTAKSVKSKKRAIADGTANAFYQCWLEEAILEGHLETVKGLNRKNPDWFFERMNKEAVSRASWIGATRGQVDEKKETEAAIMRIAAGLSTYEIECAQLGHDFRDIYSQRAREQKMLEARGLTFDLKTSKIGAQPETPEATNGAGNGAANPNGGTAPQASGAFNDGFDD